jgi:hypothetical protein
MAVKPRMDNVPAITAVVGHADVSKWMETLASYPVVLTNHSLLPHVTVMAIAITPGVFGQRMAVHSSNLFCLFSNIDDDFILTIK